MKQKNIVRLVFLLALVLIFSLPGASAKAEAAEGGGLTTASTVDFQVELDRTAVTTGKSVNLVINLLDADGQVDKYATSNGEPAQFDYYPGNVYVQLSSQLGDINENGFAAGIAGLKVADGVAIAHVGYSAPGTDNLRVSVYVNEVNDFGFYTPRLLETKTFPVQVSAAGNQATSLSYEEAVPVNSGRDNDIDDLDAGEAFVLKVTANDDHQNGTVSVKFVGNSAADDDGNVAAAPACNVVEVEGEMANGIAFIDVPAGTLTAAGNYDVYMSMPTDNPTATTGVVTGVKESALHVDALAPTKVGMVVSPAYMNLAVSHVAATVTLLDEYGNLADKTDVETATNCGLAATNHVLLDGASTDTVTIAVGDNKALYSTIVADSGDKQPAIDSATGTGRSVLTLTSADYDVDETLGTAEITIYEKSLEVILNTPYYVAGDVIYGAINVSVPDATIVGKSVKVDLYSSSNTPIDSVSSIISAGDSFNPEGDVALKFTKAATASGNYFIVSYTSSGVTYEPAKVTGDIRVYASDPTEMKLYKSQSDDYNKCAGTGTPVAEVSSISAKKGAGFYIYDSSLPPWMNDKYFVKQVDAYGNETYSNILWESDVPVPNPDEGPSGELDQIFTYSAAGTDTLTFNSTAPGVDPLVVEVNVTAPGTLGTITLVPTDDTPLVNGATMLKVAATDTNGKPIAADDMTLVIDQPSNVQVFGSIDGSGELGDQKYNGGTVNVPMSGLTLGVMAGSTAGDVTLTLRNTAGTIQGSATLHIGAVEMQNGNPAAPLDPVVMPATVDPSATPVMVNEGAVSMAPQLTVADCADVASVVAYVWMPAANAGVDVSALVTQNCDAGVLTVDFGSIDFTGFPGTYDVYYGYVDGEGAIHYSAYRLTVQ